MKAAFVIAAFAVLLSATRSSAEGEKRIDVSAVTSKADAETTLGAGEKLDAKKEFEMLSADNAKLKAIGGLGDKLAMTTAGPPHESAHALMLCVATGSALVTAGIGGIDDENAATEKAKALARKIVSRL